MKASACALWLNRVALTGLVVFVWPLLLVMALEQGGDWLHVAAANLFVFATAPLYVMVCARQYPWRSPWLFFLARYAECIQYSVACSFWLAWINPPSLA